MPKCCYSNVEGVPHIVAKVSLVVDIVQLKMSKGYHDTDVTKSL